MAPPQRRGLYSFLVVTFGIATCAFGRAWSVDFDSGVADSVDTSTFSGFWLVRVAGFERDRGCSPIAERGGERTLF